MIIEQEVLEMIIHEKTLNKCLSSKEIKYDSQ